VRSSNRAGLCLVELLVAMTIAALAGSMIMQMVIGFQSRVLVEIGRNDLQDRAERLIRFLSSEVREAAFLVGPEPRVAGNTPLALVHDSVPGDPLEELPFALIPVDAAGADDQLTIVKSISFRPPLVLAQPGLAGETRLVLNRRPNRMPGSTRELLPAPEALSHLALENHPACYTVQSADQTLQLGQPLDEDAPTSSEVLGVRAVTFLLEPYAGSKRLRWDDFTSREILDDAVDGLQFEYLLEDGTLVSWPPRPQEIRGVRICLLVRDLRPDRGFVDDAVYLLGNRSYGPFRDHFRRCLVTALVEVKNHGR
jgi:hypothetical protein